MNRPNTQEGGTSGVYAGQLKRRLKTIAIAQLVAGTESTISTATVRLLLKNLFGDLNVQITSGAITSDGNFIRPEDYPTAGTGFGTIQLTPINNFPDGSKVYMRPVFQDPTQPSNENHPLPQELPFGWEFNTRCDEVEIEVVLDGSAWISGADVNGQVVVQVTVEYNGEWWDIAAIQSALSQVTLLGSPIELPIINTQGGG